MNFVEVGQTSDLPSGAMKSYRVGSKMLLIANVNGKFYAIDNTCTHEESDLSKGKLEGKTVTCPLHGAKFDVSSGECLSGPRWWIFKSKGKNTRSYPVIIEGGSIKVNVD